MRYEHASEPAGRDAWRDFSIIEELEDRIAPSTLLFVNGKVATYTDVDGDKVTVTFSKAVLTAGNVGTVLVTAPGGMGDQLQTIDLASVATAAKGTSITVKAKPVAGTGNGYANVGEIAATGINLGAVIVYGDLGQINAGADSGKGDVALKSLTVRSLGAFGTTTGAASTGSFLLGNMGPVSVATDIENVTIAIESALPKNPAYGLAKVTVGGSITGTNNAPCNIEMSTGTMGEVTVKGSVTSAFISSGSGKVAGLKVGGDVTGSCNFYAGVSFGAISVGGSIDAGASSIVVMESPVIKGLVVKGAASALDFDAGAAKSVMINGSVDARSVLDAYQGSLGTVTVKGDFDGMILSAKSVQAVTVTGSVENAKMLVGSEQTAGPFAATFVTLGSLKVGGNWVASDLAVGAVNLGTDDAAGGTGSAADNVNYGDANDILNTAGTKVSSIKSIVINGAVSGTPSGVNATDHFGFVSGTILSMDVGGKSVPLMNGTNDLVALGNTGDVDVHVI